MYYINVTFYLRHISEFECYEESRDDDKLLCADGHTAGKWNGCIERGSYRIQCPSGTKPCNRLRKGTQGKEFTCGTTCSSQGGVRTCEAPVQSSPGRQ